MCWVYLRCARHACICAKEFESSPTAVFGTLCWHSATHRLVNPNLNFFLRADARFRYDLIRPAFENSLIIVSTVNNVSIILLLILNIFRYYSVSEFYFIACNYYKKKAKQVSF